VLDEINYLGVTTESIRGWTTHQLKTTAKGNQTLLAINICLARIPDIRTKILESVFEMLRKTRMMYGC
jgi:hypothetical protein